MKLFFTLAAIMASSLASVLPHQSYRPIQDSVALEPVPNTPSSFASCEHYSIIAKQSGTSLPGYSVVTVDASASVQSDAYLKHNSFSSYNVTRCRELCDETSVCQAFNIYFERSPGDESRDACPNPEAGTRIVCGLYDRAIQAADVVDAGQSRGPEDVNGEEFTVVIRGSNVWNKRAVEDEEKTVTITATVTVTSTALLTTTVEVSPSAPATETTSSLPASSSNGSSIVESTFVVASSAIYPYSFGLGSPLWSDVEQTTTTVESPSVISGKPVSSPDVTVTPWLDLWTRDLVTVTRTITDGSTTKTMTITMPLVH
ncbi:hypothetical protein BDU57DRAFT_592294 [Ampelomyces quisqualis]|uniref:Apple domain-containing protein n=1 Tax=Ampelomyces quisqualis TaxID=50730 RepID=A0A6A5R2X8_AMPQU|nr:hypothetical protein BDU57DRAFT_592294 [Ampelomyces quisqualis]